MAHTMVGRPSRINFACTFVLKTSGFKGFWWNCLKVEIELIISSSRVFLVFPEIQWECIGKITFHRPSHTPNHSKRSEFNLFQSLRRPEHQRSSTIRRENKTIILDPLQVFVTKPEKRSDKLLHAETHLWALLAVTRSFWIKTTMDFDNFDVFWSCIHHETSIFHQNQLERWTG